MGIRENKEKHNAGYYIGYILGIVVGLSLASLIVAATIKLILWIL